MLTIKENDLVNESIAEKRSVKYPILRNLFMPKTFDGFDASEEPVVRVEFSQNSKKAFKRRTSSFKDSMKE